MKRVFLNIGLFLMIFSVVRAGEHSPAGTEVSVPQPGTLQISQLKDEYYVFTTWQLVQGHPFPSNGMYVITDQGAVLLDTPWDTTCFQLLLDSISLMHHVPVIACIVTHYHDDRTAGLEYYQSKGIPTYSSLHTYNLCVQHNEKKAEFYFTCDTLFTFGRHHFQTTFAGAGHTEDNIVIWCREAEILYGGCLIKSTESRGLGNIVDADLRAWPRTIRKIMRMYPAPAYVIPGHWGWNNPGSPAHTLYLLRNR